MSGIKDVQVTMTRTARDRLVNNARTAAESAQQARQREQRAQSALNAANAKANALNRTLSNEITGLHEDMRHMASEQNRRLKDQATEHDRQLREQTAAQNGRLKEQAAENDRRFREQSAEQDRRLQNQADSFNRSIGDVKTQMENQRAALQNSISEVRQRSEANKKELQNAINAINAKISAKEQNHRNIANFWVEQTRAYFNDIEQYRHDMFTPGQLEKLRSRLNLMLSDFSNDAYQTAIASAREVFSNAVELKEEVVNAETEWNYYHALFQQALANTKSNLNYCQALQLAFETENGEETVAANIDYWTEGALLEIGEALSKIEQRAELIGQVSKDELIELTDSLAQLNSQMGGAASRAKEALLSSQIRAEMANTLAQALAECGWSCDGITYEGAEQAEPVHVKLTDGMGNEIVAVITPDKAAADMANQLEINFFDPKNNDEELRQTWIGSIQNGLQESGMGMGKPVCREGFEVNASNNVALRDIQATARKTNSSRKLGIK